MPEVGIFILTVVALALGWGLGWLSRSVPERDNSGLADLPDFLGSDWREGNFDPLLDALELNSSTFDTHVALGNLMRRKGAVESAIAIHQNLVDSQVLDVRQRHRAFLELACDFQKAGLLDRAENILLDLEGVAAELRLEVLRHLVELYDEVHEWRKAISSGERWLANANNVEAGNRDPMVRRVAQYYCELAEASRRSGNVKDAQQWARKAVSRDRRCFRAALVEAETRVEADPARAIDILHRALRIEPRWLAVALPLLRRAYGRRGDEDGLLEYLGEQLKPSASNSVLLAVVDLYLQKNAPEQAVVFLSERLQNQPSLQGLLRLLELQSASGRTGEAVVDARIVERLRETVDHLLGSRASYHCSHCGFSSRALYWQCLSCRQWGTVGPQVGLLGE